MCLCLMFFSHSADPKFCGHISIPSISPTMSLSGSFSVISSWLNQNTSTIRNNKRFSSQWNKAAGQISLALVVTGIALNTGYSMYQSQKIKTSPFKPRIVIIGAGMSGICAAIRLKTRLNYDNFVIYERESDIGGTWNINTYPGCACDVPGLQYSFSFDRPSSWTPWYYPPREETLKYQKSLCSKYGLYAHCKFNRSVTGMKYNENRKEWTISIVNVVTKERETVTANIVISGVGILNNKKIPKFRGLDTFKGNTFHSSEWDHSYDFKDKKVGVIGTGPTAVQVIPAVGQMPVEKLFVFQRSIGLLLPKEQASERDRKRWTAILKALPGLNTLLRGYFLSVFSDILAYSAVKTDGRTVPMFMKMGEEYREKEFGDEHAELMAATEPNGQVYAKRILLTNDLWPTYKFSAH